MYTDSLSKSYLRKKREKVSIHFDYKKIRMINNVT